MSEPRKIVLYESRFGDVLRCFWPEDGDGLALEWVNPEDPDDVVLNLRVPIEGCRRLLSELVGSGKFKR